MVEHGKILFDGANDWEASIVWPNIGCTSTELRTDPYTEHPRKTRCLFCYNTLCVEKVFAPSIVS